MLDVMSPVTDGVEATRLNLFQPSACSGGPIHIAPSRSVSCHKMMLCFRSVCKRRSAERHTLVTVIVVAYNCRPYVPPMSVESTACTGRAFLAISSPPPLLAHAHGSPSSTSVRFPTSPSNGLGQGVAWAVRRPSVIMARIRPPRPEDRSRHLVMSVVATKNLRRCRLLLQPPQLRRLRD